MKKNKSLIFVVLLCILSIGIWNYVSKFSRNTDTIDFSNLTFTPWDVRGASKFVGKRDKKPYTIMVYMNGSDLESECGAATEDLIEMQESGVDSNNVNLIVFTGGTNRWNNNLIPENECVVWEIQDGIISGIASVGLVNMGDPGTLASFIDFSVYNFPAEKYGLIMWDHGGGSIAGFGHDEKFNKSNLTLLDMNYAFNRSALAKNKLEFLGFDSCLMATLEMAEVASGYARYLIASEDLEPGAGWDYYFLSVLNANPKMSGEELGIAVVNYFMEYYGEDTDEVLTLSVVDLSNTGRVTSALDDLMGQCSNILLYDRISSFNVLASKRNMTKTFGEGSPNDNECDMVDIGDMARNLSDLYSNEARILIESLNECVLYNRHNSDISLNGLSVYYIYGGKEFGDYSLHTYKSLKVNEKHTNYLNNFFSILTSNYSAKGRRSLTSRENTAYGDVVETMFTIWRPLSDFTGKYIMTGIKEGIDFDNQTYIARNFLWPSIGGQNICMYKINSTAKRDFYAIPAMLNGNDCDIIVVMCEKYPNGKILGVRKEDGIIIQKGFDPIDKGDRLAFYYQERSFGDDGDDSRNWYKGNEFIVIGDLNLEWKRLSEDEDYFYSNLFIDVRGDEFFDDLKSVNINS